MAKAKSTTHKGDLRITKANADVLVHLTEVTGALYIRSDVKLDALTSVGGALDIRSDVKLDALTSVGGALDIWSDVKLDALTSVGGALYIRSDVKLDAPALTSVGGALDIRSDVKLDALTSVGGALDIWSDVKLDAPALTSVGGYPLPTAEVAAQRIRDVAAAALIVPSALDMSDWHTCATTHCMAGWGIHLAGPEGYKLEKKVGPSTAGAILLGMEAAAMFHTSTEVAREWLKSKLAE